MYSGSCELAVPYTKYQTQFFTQQNIKTSLNFFGGVLVCDFSCNCSSFPGNEIFVFSPVSKC